MQSPSPDPPISDVAPADRHLTGYDQDHLVTYLRLLDADAEGADCDPEHEPDRVKRAWESHLARAKWMTENGFRHLLRGGAPH